VHQSENEKSDAKYNFISFSLLGFRANDAAFTKVSRLGDLNNQEQASCSEACPAFGTILATRSISMRSHLIDLLVTSTLQGGQMTGTERHSK
jgi:hypothetical protein